MTAASLSGYVTSVPYLRRFEPDLSPPRLRLAAAVNGFAPPPDDDFDYCEIGSAQGDTLAAIAASSPSARFVGIDLSAHHVATARETVAASGIENLKFYEGDFGRFVHDGEGSELGTFDYVVAHGLWSWISDAKRTELLAFASRRLKPGGLLYLAYNTLPGWAPIEPLRRWFVDRVKDFGGEPGDAASMLAAAGRALDLAKAVNASKVGTFAANPAIGSTLATIERVGLPYLVHEYLHAHWAPMYFADVARAMAHSDLYFAGQLPLFLNFRDLAVPDPLAPLFEGVKDRIAYETLLDYAIDQTFRRDVYVKGKGGISGEAIRAYFARTPFGALDSLAIERSARLPHRTLTYAGPVFDGLVPALEQGGSTLPQLFAQPELAQFGVPRLREAILHLAVGGQIAPLLRPTHRRAASGAAFRIPLAYNRMVLARPFAPELPIVLASPVAGTGIPISPLYAVVLRALAEPDAAAREALVRSIVTNAAVLKVGDRLLDDGGDPAGAVLREAEHARPVWLPKLVELGIFQPSP